MIHLTLTNNKRETGYDILRIVSCFSVVLLHVAAIYTEDIHFIANNPSYYFSFSDFFQIITRTAVPCFFMLSGAFNLSKEIKSYGLFYKKAVDKMGFHIFFFTLLFFVYRLLRGRPFLLLMEDTLNGSVCGHFWYIIALAGLYLVTPILVKLREDIGEKSFFWVSIFLLINGSICYFTSKLFWTIDFIQYIGYYMTGYCVRSRRSQIRSKRHEKWIFYGVGLIFILLTYALNEYSFRMGKYNAGLIRNPNFPTVIVSSVAVFIAVTASCDPALSRLSRSIVDCSFIIYLAHPVVMNAINFAVRMSLGREPNPIWYVPILSISCFILTYIGANIYLSIYSKFVSPHIKNILYRCWRKDS